MKISVLLFLLMFTLDGLRAQPVSPDCAGALPVDHLRPYHVGTLSETTGEALAAPCRPGGLPPTRSFWFRWVVESPGLLAFDLLPDDPRDDLDFLLYRLPAGAASCAGKTPVRCMAAGPRIGASRVWSEDCLGATGLRAGAGDEVEAAGCPGANDNYLEALEVQPGEVYALWVNNYTSAAGFTLRFTGDARLGAEGSAAAPFPVRAFPNPVRSELFVAAAPPAGVSAGRLTVLDARGRTLLIRQGEAGGGGLQWRLDTERWRPGVYWLRVEAGGKVWSGKVERM